MPKPLSQYEYLQKLRRARLHKAMKRNPEPQVIAYTEARIKAIRGF